ncbi:MAG: hypothetical protein HY549_00750 [Elusimicrobia bacterium]|nr:hypothetical protein [Elusimicrobiota bacterium]
MEQAATQWIRPRTPKAAGTVRVDIQGFPYPASTVTATAYRIPGADFISAISSPTQLPAWSFPVVAGTISLTLNNFADGDVICASI